METIESVTNIAIVKKHATWQAFCEAGFWSRKRAEMLIPWLDFLLQSGWTLSLINGHRWRLRRPDGSQVTNNNLSELLDAVDRNTILKRLASSPTIELIPSKEDNNG